MTRDPSTGAQDVYYNCVNSSATQSFEVTPEHVYDRLLSSSSTGVCISLLQWESTQSMSQLRNHAGGISGLTFAFSAILAVSYRSCCTTHRLIIISYLCTAKVHSNLTSSTTRHHLISTCRPSTAQMRWRQARCG